MLAEAQRRGGKNKVSGYGRAGVEATFNGVTKASEAKDRKVTSIRMGGLPVVRPGWQGSGAHAYLSVLRALCASARYNLPMIPKF